MASKTVHFTESRNSLGRGQWSTITHSDLRLRDSDMPLNVFSGMLARGSANELATVPSSLLL